MSDIGKKLKELLLSGGVSPEDFRDITSEIHKSNRQNIIIFSL